MMSYCSWGLLQPQDLKLIQQTANHTRKTPAFLSGTPKHAGCCYGDNTIQVFAEPNLCSTKVYLHSMIASESAKAYSILMLVWGLQPEDMKEMQQKVDSYKENATISLWDSRAHWVPFQRKDYATKCVCSSF